MEQKKTDSRHETTQAFLKKKIEELRKSIAYYEGIQAILDNDGQMIEETHRWDKECFCSPRINPIANRWEVRKNCGCCADTIIEAFPYVEENGLKIYTQPSVFVIGQANYGNGIIPTEKWEENMAKANISPAIIGDIRSYLEKHEPRDIEDEEEEDEA